MWSARTQPIIVNATNEMLKDHILPVAEKLKENARKMEKEEEQYLVEKRSRSKEGDEESEIQEVNKLREEGVWSQLMCIN